MPKLSSSSVSHLSQTQIDRPRRRLSGRSTRRGMVGGGRRLPDGEGKLSINELILDYVRHAEQYYRRPDGSQTAELGCLKLALRALRKLYGDTSADDFGPSLAGQRCLEILTEVVFPSSRLRH